MVCLRNISVDTLHKGDTENDNDNNNNYIIIILYEGWAIYELQFVNRTKALIYSPKLKLLLFNIISVVCDTLAPTVRKLADAAQEEVFWLPV